MTNNQPTQLRRTLTLPWLIFYGVGVTVGAGIFALVGEVIGLAGDQAPLAFLLAGLVAAFTGFAYALLAGVYPRAAGEAVFVREGFGKTLGAIVGFAIVVVAITSSATISIAFGGYSSAFLPVSPQIAIVAILLVLGLVAWRGIRESVMFAAIITVLEIGTLIVIVAVGLPHVHPANIASAFQLPTSGVTAMAIVAGAFVAFFAFVGFEDIENMAEETRNPKWTIPRAIIYTLVISTAIYTLVAIVAAAFDDRAALVASSAPIALLFARWSGLPGEPVSAMASIAMVNGILVQIVMASRVLYGMGNDGMAPKFLARLDPNRQTPALAIGLVTVAIAVLALSFNLLGLARTTSLIMLLVFTLVNLSLFIIGGHKDAVPILRKWRLLGLVGAIVSLSLAAADVTQSLS